MSALVEDKKRLAKNIDSYHSRARKDNENQEELRIENSLWRSKFMAIAIKADDLYFNLHKAITLFKRGKTFFVGSQNASF
jgi:hypothetical protein